MNPLVTIAIPTFRRADLLRRALQSAVSQAGVEGGMEILVVENPDDAATSQPSDAERLCASLSDPRLRYVRNDSNLGMVGNWNRCLELARGRWVLILHDDDWLSPHFMRLVLGLLDAHPDLRMVGTSGVLEKGEEGTPPRLRERLKPYRIELPHFWLGNPYFAPSVVMDRELALQLGGFDEAWYPTMDHVFWMRFCAAAPCARLPEPLVHYYIGANASLKPQMLIRYIVNDFRQRQELMRLTFPKQRWLTWYSRLKPHHERLFLQKFFDLQVPEQQLREALLEVGWRPLPRWLSWIYTPMRLGMELLSILLSKRLTRIRSLAP